MNNRDGKMVHKGLLFIKSMASQEDVMLKAIADAKKAHEFNIELPHAYLDSGYNRSVDREEIYNLLEYLAGGEYQVLVVEDIKAITGNVNDLQNIMDKIQSFGVTIFDLGFKNSRFNNYNEEC